MTASHRLPDSLIQSVRDRIVPSQFIGQHVKLKREGHEHVGLCPFHHEKTPSFSVNDKKQFYHCFGCLDEAEQIWTSSGLRPIGEILEGDHVLDRYGHFSPVIATHHNGSQQLHAIEVQACRRDPLLLTANHTCLAVTREAAMYALPYIFHRHDNRLAKGGFRFTGNYKKQFASDNQSFERYSTRGPPRVISCRADSLKEGDYFLFPVIGDVDRNHHPLRNDGIILPYKRGRRTPRITELPCTATAARLYGLYLAEGSLNPRSVRWTFCIDELHTLAAEVVRTLKDEFGLTSTLYIYQSRNTCEVICSKTDLSRQFGFWFGKGAAKKRIPGMCLSWPRYIQHALVEAYLEGDGRKLVSKAGVTSWCAKTISRDLANGIYALCIQSRRLASYVRNVPTPGRDRCSRKPYWTIYIRTRENMGGFFEWIGDTEYYWSSVISVAATDRSANVVDLTVTNAHSFVTRVGMVHNCGSHGDVISFAMAIYRMPFKETVLALASENGLDTATAIIDPRVLERNDRRDREHEAQRKSILEAAIRIWNEALPAENSPVERYLRSRAITCPIPSTLRYHPELTYRINEKTRIILPAMVAEICRDDELVAIHRTFLQRDGSGKATVSSPKLMLGDARGGGIHLGSVLGPVSDPDTIAVSEGIENGLSYQMITGIPAIAAGSTSGMKSLRLPDPPMYRNVIIAGDNDSSGTQAAHIAQERWRNEGRTARVHIPALVKDWNDELRAILASDTVRLMRQYKAG